MYSRRWLWKWIIVGGFILYTYRSSGCDVRWWSSGGLMIKSSHSDADKYHTVQSMNSSLNALMYPRIKKKTELMIASLSNWTIIITMAINTRVSCACVSMIVCVWFVFSHSPNHWHFLLRLLRLFSTPAIAQFMNGWTPNTARPQVDRNE